MLIIYENSLHKLAFIVTNSALSFLLPFASKRPKNIRDNSSRLPATSTTDCCVWSSQRDYELHSFQVIPKWSHNAVSTPVQGHRTGWWIHWHTFILTHRRDKKYIRSEQMVFCYERSNPTTSTQIPWWAPPCSVRSVFTWPCQCHHASFHLSPKTNQPAFCSPQ